MHCSDLEGGEIDELEMIVTLPLALERDGEASVGGHDTGDRDRFARKQRRVPIVRQALANKSVPRVGLAKVTVDADFAVARLS